MKFCSIAIKYFSKLFSFNFCLTWSEPELSVVKWNGVCTDETN